MVPLNDIDESDIESLESVDSVEPFAPPVSELLPDEAARVPSKISENDISDFHLALGFWCDKEGLKRRSYNGLLEILRLLDHSEIRRLPQKLSTLLTWSRSRIPLAPIIKTKISVKPGKQPTGIRKPKVASLYHFDLRTMVSTLLSTTNISKTTHFGMANIVDAPFELWHSPCWGSSIRMCSNDYLRYNNGLPIFPSDFVEYRCQDSPCLCRKQDGKSAHLGRVIFFGRDRRANSASMDTPLLIIQRATDLSDPRLQRATNFGTITWYHSDLVLWEDLRDMVQTCNIIKHVPDIQVARYLNKPWAPDSRWAVRFVFNLSRSMFRPIAQMSALRAELEIEAFGRSYLESMLRENVTSFPLLIFIDDFGLYRNMYRSLTGIYAVSAGLSARDRQKSINAHCITLGPHGSDFNDVFSSIRDSIVAVDRGCLLNINGHNRRVWAPIVAFLGDMKQQQASAGFLGARANVCCRFCDADLDTRTDLSRDLSKYGRYHHQTVQLRRDALTLRTMKERLDRLSLNGLSAEASTLQSITPALDIIMSRPMDPAHSEYYGLVRRLYVVLCDAILTKKALSQLTRALQKFQFPRGWGRIQSLETHKGSWSMSECAKASVVIPLLLRSWLRLGHIRHQYRYALSTSNTVDTIVSCFAKLARSNMLISAFKLDHDARLRFHTQVLEAREAFRHLMDAAPKPKPKSKTKSKTGAPRGTKNAMPAIPSTASTSRRGSITQSSTGELSDVSLQDSLCEIESQDNDGLVLPADDTTFPDQVSVTHGGAAQLPNFHIGMHFASIMEEYAVLWNVNVLFGEDKHRYTQFIYLR